MALRVRELTEIPYLRTRLIAGTGGAEREIGWAHSVEVPNPWEWLEPADLLMTVGIGVPEEPVDQVEYVERLADLGISGIAIGEEMGAPPFSPEMLAAAEQRQLPLMSTAREVPFSQVGRVVAASNRGVEHERLLQSMRVYDLARQAVARRSSPSELMRELGRAVDCTLYICERSSGVPALDGLPPPPPEILDAFLRVVDAGDTGPALQRVAVRDWLLLILQVPARRPLSLLAVSDFQVSPPFAVLEHVATIAALEEERQWAKREERRRLGSEILAQLIDSGGALGSVAAPLRLHGLDADRFVLAAMALTEDRRYAGGRLHHDLSDRRVGHLLLRRDDSVYCLLPDSPPAVEILAAALGSDREVGLSRSFGPADSVGQAAREARWALDTASVGERRVVCYDEDDVLLAPRSPEEAQAIVDFVLAPVIAHDRQQEGELLASLEAFLACNRSWQKASKQLFVHKQTLVYRIRKVEELTGRRLNDTASVAELWLALEAHKRLCAQP